MARPRLLMRKAATVRVSLSSGLGSVGSLGVVRSRAELLQGAGEGEMPRGAARRGEQCGALLAQLAVSMVPASSLGAGVSLRGCSWGRAEPW